MNRGPNSCNLAFFWFSKTYRCCRTYSSRTTTANHENVVTLIVEGDHATTLKLGSSYDSAVKAITTRIHRAKETTEATSQTRGEVVQEQEDVLRDSQALLRADLQILVLGDRAGEHSDHLAEPRLANLHGRDVEERRQRRERAELLWQPAERREHKRQLLRVLWHDRRDEERLQQREQNRRLLHHLLEPKPVVQDDGEAYHDHVELLLQLPRLECCVQLTRARLAHLTVDYAQDAGELDDALVLDEAGPELALLQPVVQVLKRPLLRNGSTRAELAQDADLARPAAGRARLHQEVEENSF